MTIEIGAYVIVSAVNLLTVIVSVVLLIIGKHALAQWRLNRPAPKPVPAQPQAGTSKGAVI